MGFLFASPYKYQKPKVAVLEIIPIAPLKGIDDGEMDYKVIAIPKNKSERIIRAITMPNSLLIIKNSNH